MDSLTVDDFVLDLTGDGELVHDVRTWDDDTTERSTFLWLPADVVMRGFMWGVDPDDLSRLHGQVAAIVFEYISGDNSYSHEVTLYPNREDAVFAWEAMQPNRYLTYA